MANLTHFGPKCEIRVTELILTRARGGDSVLTALDYAISDEMIENREKHLINYIGKWETIRWRDKECRAWRKRRGNIRSIVYFVNELMRCIPGNINISYPIESKTLL